MQVTLLSVVGAANLCSFLLFVSLVTCVQNQSVCFQQKLTLESLTGFQGSGCHMALSFSSELFVVEAILVFFFSAPSPGMENDMICMMPPFGDRDLIISGTWRAWGNWAWWVWIFQSGWCEWYPAYQFLSRYARITQGNWHERLMSIIQKVHAHLGLPAVTHEHSYYTQQLAYAKHAKSNWWYETVPDHSIIAGSKFVIV